MAGTCALLLLTAAALTSCSDKKVTVVGNMENTGDTLVVYGTGNDYPDTLIVTDGHFTYSAEVEKPHPIYIVQPEKAAVMLLAVPGEKAELTGDMTGDYVIGGSTFYKEFDELMKMLKEATQENATEQIMNYVREHPNSEAAGALLPPILGGVAPDSLDTFLGLLSDKVKNGRMKEYIDDNVNAMKEQIEEQSKAKELQAEGREVPDFTLNDLNGNPLSLSSLRGKYVILDFWGSWCGWCIKGIPQMKEYYQKYKGKFEILGIDCSDTDEAWRKAVAENELPWLHVYNPEDGDVPELYGIQGFPTKIIVDPEGKIYKTVVGEDPAFYTLLDELFGE